MKSVGIVFLFLFLSGYSIGQSLYFRLNTTGKNSFYDKTILKALNKELQTFKREKNDTAFVYIDDSGGSMINSYVYIKKKKESHLLYFLFNTKRSKYYKAELYPEKINLPNISYIYTILYDKSYQQTDTSNIVISESYSCNLYFGMGKYDKQLWISSTKLTSDFGYVASRDSYELSNYFAAEDFSDKSKLPAIVKRYHLMKYEANKKR